MELCPDESSQTTCATASQEGNFTCEGHQKWCRKYTIETVPEGNNGTMGYIPLTSYCHDETGEFTQAPGRALDVNGGTAVGNCYYGNGVTRVNRSLAGDYAYCGGDGTICNDTFAGGWWSESYDPRYRPWYIKTKEIQVPNWSPPYVFTTNEIGITHSHPIYTNLPDGKGQRFDGVLAIDYRCKFTISVMSFLSHGEN